MGTGRQPQFFPMLESDLAEVMAVETVFLEVRASNHPAFRLHQRAGFGQVGLRRDYYPAGNGREDALILALTL